MFEWYFNLTNYSWILINWPINVDSQNVKILRSVSSLKFISSVLHMMAPRYNRSDTAVDYFASRLQRCTRVCLFVCLFVCFLFVTILTLVVLSGEIWFDLWTRVSRLAIIQVNNNVTLHMSNCISQDWVTMMNLLMWLFYRAHNDSNNIRHIFIEKLSHPFSYH